MNHMAGTPTQDFKDGNKIEFVVIKEATKKEIKEAFEEHFEVKVVKVWTKITKEGKQSDHPARRGLLGGGYRNEDWSVLRG